MHGKHAPCPPAAREAFPLSLSARKTSGKYEIISNMWNGNSLFSARDRGLPEQGLENTVNNLWH
jgi:hypothetical protein